MAEQPDASQQYLALISEYDESLEQFSRRAYDLVVAEARRIVEAMPDDINEFCMAMGGCTFTGKRGGKFDPDEFSEDDYDSDRIRMDSSDFIEEQFAPEFFEMVREFDDRFKVTSNPVRFKAGMKPVYDW